MKQNKRDLEISLICDMCGKRVSCKDFGTTISYYTEVKGICSCGKKYKFWIDVDDIYDED